MKRPLDIPEEVWTQIPEELQYSLSRNVNRSFINPLIEINFKKIKTGQILNHKVNTALNELRALVIETVKDGVNTEMLVEMMDNQTLMRGQMLTINEKVDQVNEHLNEFLNFIDSRIKFYKGVL